MRALTFTIFDVLRDSAARSPESRFLEDDQRSVTFREAADDAAALAVALADRGIGSGDRVAIYMEKSRETILAMYAAAALGAVFITINPEFKSVHVRHILEDSGAAILFLTARTRRRLEKGGDAVLVSLLAQRPVVECDAGGGGAFADLLAAGRARLASAPFEPPVRLDTDLAALLYTSGSTGMPKGVAVPNASLVQGAQIVSSYLGLTPADRILSVLPLSFDYGLNQVLAAAQVGCTVVLTEYLLVADLVRKLHEARITGLAGTPMIWVSLSEYFQRHPDAVFPPLRYMTNSGGRIPERHVLYLDAISGDAQFFLMYGLTEAFRSTCLPPSELRRRPTSMGKPVPGVEIMVLNAEGRPCGPDESGELVHRGAFITLGYYNLPEKTAEMFRPNPLVDPARMRPDTVVYSGDIVRRDADGFLYFVERRDSMLKRRGYRISPEEIELTVNGVPGVVVSAVAGRDAGVDIDLVAFVVLEPGRDAAGVIDAIGKAVAHDLPPYMAPAEIRVMSAMPQNVNGKIDRRTLREWAAAPAKELVS